VTSSAATPGYPRASNPPDNTASPLLSHQTATAC
jgi:hypothetical protein